MKNSDTTKWLQFWKLPARKVHAIPNIPAPEGNNTELLEQIVENTTTYVSIFAHDILAYLGTLGRLGTPQNLIYTSIRKDHIKNVMLPRPESLEHAKKIEGSQKLIF